MAALLLRKEAYVLEAPPLERKLVAILAADVVGYSQLMHEDEEGTLATLTSHRTIIDALISSGHGDLSSTAGDSVLAEFASVVDAIHCAVAIQQALHGANEDLAAERRMELRIGINIGDVMVKDGGIFGDGVNVAARLEGLAEPGGICISRGVRDHLRDRVNYTFDDLGEHSVKNIARPVRVFRVVFDREGDAKLSPVASPIAPTAGNPREQMETDEVEVAFWQSVEASGNPEEYRQYLRQYPTGAFVALAQTRLSPAAKTTTSADRDVELSYWDSVKDAEDPALFKAYLEKYPEGEFKDLADIQIRKLSKSA
jgi:adenylate cyclase